MSPDPIRIRALRYRDVRIPFKTAFRHASAERAETSSIWVEAFADDGLVGYGESCPRPYVTGETLESARAFVERSEAAVRGMVADPDHLRAWVGTHRRDIDANPAAWCGIELAIVDLIGKSRRQSIERVLSRPPLTGDFTYTAVLGDASPDAFRAIAVRYWHLGFRDFKVKLSGDLTRDRHKLDVFDSWRGEPFRLRADANNLWPDADHATAALEALARPLFAVEEPIQKGRYVDLLRIADRLDCRVVLDESLTTIDQVRQLPGSATRWLVNVRVSKMGGLLRSLELTDVARARGVGIIVGAHVGELSLLTRAGLTVAHAAGPALVAQEGAFGTHLLERDVCDPPLMFGPAGVLRSSHPALAGYGLGSFTPPEP